MAKLRILFVVRLETAFRELFRVAKFVLRTGHYQPVFYFYDLSPSLERMREACNEKTIEYILEDNLTKQAHQSIFDLLIAITTRFLPGKCREIILNTRYLRVILECDRRVIKKVNPSVIIVPEDGIGGKLTIIKLARKQRIPVIVVPYEYSTKRQPVQAIKSYPNYRTIYGMQTILNRMVGRLFPRWILISEGEKLLRQQTTLIIPLELMRLSPIDPWTVHGGHANFIAVESERMYKHYLREGIPQQKLCLTGTLADDDLFHTLSAKEQLRVQLYRSFDLPENFKMVLCALPGDYTSRSQCEFDRYEDLIDFWLSTLMQLEGTNVVFQLHPSISPVQEEYILSKGVKVAYQNIAELIPLCDIFVSSVSSVIRMAITCQKPTINYDVYQFKYTDYDETRGVITTQKKEDFINMLRKLACDEDFYKKTVDSLEQSSKEWGLLDGKSGNRLHGLIDKLSIT